MNDWRFWLILYVVIGLLIVALGISDDLSNDSMYHNNSEPWYKYVGGALTILFGWGPIVVWCTLEIFVITPIRDRRSKRERERNCSSSVSKL